MINWDEFEHIHVIQKLKHILNSWWNVDIIFTDEQGKIRGMDKLNFSNPSVRYFLGKKTACEHLVETISKSIESLRLSDQRHLVKKWDTSGFDMVIIPIFIENEVMGSVVALGFLKKRGGKPAWKKSRRD